MYNYPLSLMASFIAMAFSFVSYFLKKKSLYLLFQILCIVFLLISYFFTVQFFAMVGMAIGATRTLVYFLYERKNLNAPLWVPFVISAASLISYVVVNLIVLKSANPFDILCVAGLIGYAFTFRIRDLRAFRFWVLVPTVFSILYNTLSGAALFASLSYTLDLIADVVAIYKYHIRPQKKQCSDIKDKGNEEETATSATGN